QAFHREALVENAAAVRLEKACVAAHVGLVLPVGHEGLVQIEEVGPNRESHPHVPVGALAERGIEPARLHEQLPLTEDGADAADYIAQGQEILERRSSALAPAYLDRHQSCV